LAVTDRGDIFACGELSSEILRYRVGADTLQRAGSIDLGRGRTVRDIAVSRSDPTGNSTLLYAVDQREGRLITLRVAENGVGHDGLVVEARDELPIGHGPIRVARFGPALVVNCLLDHTVVVMGVDGRGLPQPLDAVRIRHDGPIWSFDASAAGGELLLALGGIEDHPLDRTGGSFGYIDSVLTLYRIALQGKSPKAVRWATVNLSALGVVTPKVIALETLTTGGLRALVTGYGSSAMATLTWPADLGREPGVTITPLSPGTTSMVTRADGARLFADPLLDAWLVRTPSGMTTVPVAGAATDRPREPSSRLGEALFFTTLMAPWNRSEGALSRFTCESCHFEGHGDGRTHHTGRGEVHATTKPLRGLFNNRPYFSRALDPDLATVAHNEFRVAGANSGHDPWFAVRTADFPWLGSLGITDSEVGPLDLRRALMLFLMDYTHLPNPAAVAGTGWNRDQRAGAVIFRDHCEGCHQARLDSSDPTSRVRFEEWEGLVMSDAGPLVWGLDEYRKTGVMPYVHERGARVPSLRRLHRKFPYFTNGSARDLDEVIARVRFAGD
ncbi:MAG TPA: hypothetical protein VF518_16855, partial [Polyangia bacterium]